jgi:hypothetical protein
MYVRDDHRSSSRRRIAYEDDIYIVDLKPQILIGINERLCLTNENASFYCEFFSKSENFVVQWYHKSRLISSDLKLTAKKYHIQTDINKTVLTIKNIQLEDEGHYECLIINEYGSNRSSAYLRVNQARRGKIKTFKSKKNF